MALLILAIGTFLTSMVGHAFAKPEAVRLDLLLGAVPSEAFDVPPHLGGGQRECYVIRSPFDAVVGKVRQALIPAGWKEIAVSPSPRRSLFSDGDREVQILQGKVRGGEGIRTASSRLEARSMTWEPHSEWVSVVFDAPSTHPSDRLRGLLRDLA